MSAPEGRFIPDQRSQLALGLVSLAALLAGYLHRRRWGRRPAEAQVEAALERT